MINWKLYVTALLLPLALGWKSCSAPTVEYFSVDEGAGHSFAYGVTAMASKSYVASYVKGAFHFTAEAADGFVPPAKDAAIFLDTEDYVGQSVTVAELSASGKHEKTWLFEGINARATLPAGSAVKAMLDNEHVALAMSFPATSDSPVPCGHTVCYGFGGGANGLVLPDLTVLNASVNEDGTPREYSANPGTDPPQISVVAKIDVSEKSGIGPGTTGWHFLPDSMYPGGVSSIKVKGDVAGNMIMHGNGCAVWSPTVTIESCSWGRCTSTTGVGEVCEDFIMSLAASDGSMVWKTVAPTSFLECEPVLDGSIYCAYTMQTSVGALDFGNGAVAPTIFTSDNKGRATGVVKYDGSSGQALWVKATMPLPVGNFAVSPDASLMAASSGVSIARIDFSKPYDPDLHLAWGPIDSGSGSHGGPRTIEVFNGGGNTEVLLMGQHVNDITIADVEGETANMKSFGDYDVWVASYDATTGAGKWAFDAGSSEVGSGTGDYCFASGADPVSGAMYVACGVYDGPERFVWGERSRLNAFHHTATQKGGGAPSRNTPVGDSKAFVAKLKTTTSLPSCLSSCDEASGLQESDVMDGYCYIERYCYKDGDFARYPGSHCLKCNSAVNKIGWDAPDTTEHCFIDGKCYDNGEHRDTPKTGPWPGKCYDSTGTVVPERDDGKCYDNCKKCDITQATDAWSNVTGCLLPMSFVGAADSDGVLRNGVCELTDFEGGMFYQDGSVGPVWELEATAAGWGPLSCGSGQTAAQRRTSEALRQRRVMKVAEGEQWWP